MADAELTIGEVARRTGVAASALRFYESQSLISATRTDGNQRRYARATLRRIAFIQAGKAAGIPLAEIQAALDRLPAERAPNRTDPWLDSQEAADYLRTDPKRISELVRSGRLRCARMKNCILSAEGTPPSAIFATSLTF